MPAGSVSGPVGEEHSERGVLAAAFEKASPSVASSDVVGFMGLWSRVVCRDLGCATHRGLDTLAAPRPATRPAGFPPKNAC